MIVYSISIGWIPYTSSIKKQEKEA